MSKSLSDEQRELNNARIRAVNQAKRDEVALIKKGMGTRDWTTAQQKEWLQTGKCHDIEGHHMKDVSTYPEYAGDKNNIQMLNSKEHFAAHRRDYKNTTNGYYDPNTNKIKEFGEKPPTAPKAEKLSSPLSERAVKYNTTMRKNAEAQKAEAKKLKSEGKIESSSKARKPEKSTIEKTDSKTLASCRKNTSVSKSNSTQSKTLSRDRSTASSAGKSITSPGKTNTHRHTRSH